METHSEGQELHMEITDVRTLTCDHEGVFDFPDDHLPREVRRMKRIEARLNRPIDRVSIKVYLDYC